MAYDQLLRLSGPNSTATVTTPIEAAPITADADGAQGYKYVGKQRTGYLECRIAGAFDRTSSDEVMAFEVHEAVDASGTNAVLIASSANLTSSHAANLNTGNGTLSSGPTRVGFNTGAGGYIKVRFNVGGTTPSAASVSADVVMTGIAVAQSGT